MKIFTVYRNPDARDEADSVRLVPEEFSWWCFFFPFNIFWGLKHHCWLFALACAAILTGYLYSYISPISISPYINITKLPVQMFLGLFANDFYRFSLRLKGFEFVDIISGKNEDEALHAWLASKY